MLKDKKFQNPDLSKFIQHLAYAVMNHQIVQLKMKRTWLKDQNFQNLEIQIYMYKEIQIYMYKETKSSDKIGLKSKLCIHW